MEMQAISLNVHPQIIDLYEVLEQNGLHKQKEEVQSLVGYIESMEYNLSVMMSEIQEMHTEVNRLHDKGIRAQCAKIVSKVEDKVQQAKTMVSIVKVKTIQSAGNAVKAFQEKGKSALIQAVQAIRIPSVLSSMKNGFSHAAQSVHEGAEKLDGLREQIHEAGAYMKNAGRALSGKAPAESGKLQPDKGLLAKIRNGLESFSSKLSDMGYSTDRLLGKIQPEKEPEELKQSVKSELRQLKNGRSEPAKAPVVKEQAR